MQLQLIALVAWTALVFSAGWMVESWRSGEKVARDNEAQQQVTIAAEQGVIARQQQSASITNNMSKRYENDLFTIDSLYDLPDGVLRAGPPAGGDLRPVSRTTAGACSCPKTSKEYQLTFRQCDVEEEKLSDLWDWIGKERQ